MLCFRYQTGGTILAGKLALERGWAINVGGGFHHCSANKGGGFCPYADITLLIQFLFQNYPLQIKRVLIVDLDAHQVIFHSFAVLSFLYIHLTCRVMDMNVIFMEITKYIFWIFTTKIFIHLTMKPNNQ